MVMFGSDPRMRLDKLALLTIPPVLLPWLVGVLGYSTLTVSSSSGDLVQHTPFMSVRLPGGPIAYAIYIIFTILMGGIAARKLALDERAARRTIELQAWHLRRLVSS
jgi:hypothetical protein